MTKLFAAVALAVFLLFFGVYSFRLGIAPEFRHDDYEYTYPSFSLAERGNFGSPLLGPGLNIQNRTYNLTVYYYATVHALLIRIFGDGPSSIPLANTFHFALLAAGGAFFLMRRHAFLGLGVFLYALTSDEGIIEAARHGRPEMTAGFCLLMGVLGLGYPAPGQYSQGRWSPAFREGVREVWGAETLASVDARPLCWAMGLVFIQPKWVLSWNWDDSVMLPFRDFLRRFPDLPGIQLSEAGRTPLPPPYGGTVRVYRLGLSDAMGALDRSSTSAHPPCP